VARPASLDAPETAVAGLPAWAAGMADLHTHASPSLLPRHGDDAQTVAAERELGFSTVVLKSHEGSTVERATIAGRGVYGGIVLNSATGGANPDAIEIASRLGGRIVWMPTVSARTHKAGAASPELSVHRGFELGPVDVVDDGVLRPEWHGVLDVIAAHDLVLASGHLSAAETVVLFRQARRHGVNRLMVNHPMMAFLGWNAEAAQVLQELSQMKYRYVDLDNVQIQLCEPPKLDCPQRRFLDTHGEGVFHIGFESDLDTATSQARASRLDVIMSGRRENGTGFVYFDTLDQAGVVWMCRQTKPVPS